MGRRTLIEMLRLPTRRETIRTLCAGLSIAVVCWYFGVDVWHAILLGCAITVIALAAVAGTSTPDARDLSWRPGKRVRNDGSRNDVASLSSSLHAGWGFVGLTAERRLHLIAARRLALDGLDLRDAEHRLAIERRIGGRAYRILQRGQRRRLRLRTLRYSLDMLDAIDPNHYPTPMPRSQGWDLQSTLTSLGRARER